MDQLPEATRLANFDNVSSHSRLVHNSGGKTMRRLKPGMTRLLRFQNMLACLHKAPWSNMRFAENEHILKLLTLSHLPLVVGEYYESEKTALETQIGVTNCQNLVWITNRQQGKTTTLARFLAALSILAPVQGSLCCIYSTNLDRACELLKATKAFINFIGNVDIIINNTASLTIRTVDGFSHTVAARPKTPDSCRGDAPKMALFDEIAFCTAAFWHQFAFPLLTVGRRIFTCVTTPPHEGTFFDVFSKTVIARNKANDFFFRLINHSLVCAACIEAGEEEKCTHKLYLIPPWKSLLRFNSMKKLVPVSQLETFNTEVFGVLQQRSGTYIPPELVETFLSLPTVSLFDCGDREPVYVAIDPPSHNVSAIGLCAITYTLEGQIILLGAAEVLTGRADTLQLQAVVGRFLEQLRAHPGCGNRPIVPIIECNNNEVLSLSLLGVFYHHGTIIMPFTNEHFGGAITDHTGVWTTDQNKPAMLQACYTVMLDRRLRVIENPVTTSKRAYAPNAEEPEGTAMVKHLCEQLKNFKDLPNGKISGTTADGQKDDLGMALLLAIYWSFCVRALGAV